VIDRLREEYNQQIPALLVSADLSPLRLKQALAKGLVLLDKPPSPRSLEQAVAAALAPRWTAAAPLP
jgi:CheY-like chemotaxis protein